VKTLKWNKRRPADAVAAPATWRPRVSCVRKPRQLRGGTRTAVWSPPPPPYTAPRPRSHRTCTRQPACMQGQLAMPHRPPLGAPLPRPPHFVGAQCQKSRGHSSPSTLSRECRSRLVPPSLLRPTAPLLILLRLIPVPPSTRSSHRRPRPRRPTVLCSGHAGGRMPQATGAALPSPAKAGHPLARFVVTLATFPSEVRSPPVANSGCRRGSPPPGMTLQG
jgi:hypothetical protein